MKPIFAFLFLTLCAYSCRPTKITQTKTGVKTVFDTVYVTDTVKITMIDSIYYQKYMQLKEILSITKDSIKEITRPDGSTERTTYGEKQIKKTDSKNFELLNRILSLDFSQKIDSSSIHRENSEMKESSSRIPKASSFWRAAALLQFFFIILFLGYKRYKR